MRSIQSLGGIARGKIQRQEALDKYYKNPNFCKECFKTIQVLSGQKLCITRKKKFCNHSCSAKFNNRNLPKQEKKIRFCKKCLITVVLGRDRICDACKMPDFGERTKADVFDSRCNWQSARSSIRRHAVLVWKRSGKKLECDVCKYDIYVEIAHINPVSSFSKEATINQINAIDNLKALCPNHHWEFDNLSRGSETVS